MSIHRKPTQPTLFDYQDRLTHLQERPRGLDVLRELVDFEVFRPALEEATAVQAAGPGGRPRFDPVFMFKILILQQIYDLSDAEAEYQILDRFSFQRFLGITVSDRVPDQSTIWLFREQLRQSGALEICFATFGQFLHQQGVVGTQGKIVDATFVDAPRQRNTPKENEQIKQGQRPAEWQSKSPAQLRQKDVDARWGKKYGESHFGYKNHVKVDAHTKLIERFAVTPANRHDSVPFAELVDPEDKILHADRSYDTRAVRSLLAAWGIEARIAQQQRHPKRPLSQQQREQAKVFNRIRVRVEHVFAAMAIGVRRLRLRSIGLDRAQGYLALANLTYNLRRWAFLKKGQVSA